jgi:hypothetical protein
MGALNVQQKKVSRNDATLGRGTLAQREESKILNSLPLRSLRRCERPFRRAPRESKMAARISLSAGSRLSEPDWLSRSDY